MGEIRLVLKLKTRAPLEAEVISPDIFAGKAMEEIADQVVWNGNAKMRLGDFFDITGDSSGDIEKTHIVVKGDTSRVKYIGNKMTGGKIVVEGDADMHLGEEMRGGKIVVEGSVDSFVALGMRGGELRIKGNAGNYLGAAYRGEWRGMSGGKIVVDGNAGSEVGAWMRGGLIIVKKSAGPYVGVHMKGGTIAIEGDAGPRIGAQMLGGTIVVFGKADEMLPSFSFSGVVPSINVEDKRVDGPFLKFVGDNSEGGKGEIYLLKKNNECLASQM